MSRIEITLKSDLCAASGDGFSSIIDTDVSYDKNGFPVIGGRRIKGCLRDVAKLIASDNLDGIFGISGDSKSGSLKISDALIENYDTLKKEVVNSDRTSAEIISLFTYTKASTAIENDTAKDNSLRFTRVVRHYSPFDNTKEMKFIAEVDIDKKYADEFADICKGLRNIGYKRNRGFGAVQCRFFYEENKSAVSTEFNMNSDECTYSYTIKLKENVMLPGNSADETADYISGTAVLGFVAGKYISKYGMNPEFDEIFPKNNVRFSNLYISDENGREYFPAPVILGKIKGEKGTFNIIKYDGEKIVKPVKSGYCDFNSSIIKPMTETVYHHSKGENATLYTQTSLCKDQYFSGTISGKTEYVKKIAEIIETSDIRFGRSKTAQYSNCKLVKSSCKLISDKKINVKKGDTFIALLLSDILIPDEYGGYDISADGLLNELKKVMGDNKFILDRDEKSTDEEPKRKYSALRYRIISGYNTKWNMQKPHIRTIASGSTLVFKAIENITLPKRVFLGAKQNEGFGQVMFCKADDFAEVSNETTSDNKPYDKSDILEKLLENSEKTEKMRNDALGYAGGYNEEINSSQIGRYMLIVKKAERLSDIKTLINSVFENKNAKTDKEKIQKNKSIYLLEKLIKDSNAEAYGDMWKEYLLLILTLIKYTNRGEKE